MNIFHYRKTDFSDNPWKDCIITSDTPLSAFRSKSLISVNGQTVIRQHASTYLTGRDTCLAHHFAKMLAAGILSGSYQHAPGMKVSLPESGQGGVLWIDSVRGIHSCADFFNEMSTAFDPKHERFALLCLDKLGSFRYDFYALLEHIEKAIEYTKPSLIVIDDIDHLMPYCGINVADAFCHAVRDTLNHTDAAFLFIGYNHLGKRTATTGNLGKFLFSMADNIFSVTSQQAISRVKIVRSYTVETNHDVEFLFTVDEDNLPHQVIRTVAEPADSNYIQQNTLRDIIGDCIKPGETISPDDLFKLLNNRRQQLNRNDRTRALIAQATQLGIIKKVPDSNDYTLNTQSITPIDNDLSLSSPPCRDTVAAPSDPAVNNSLTLPPHPQPSPFHNSVAAPA